MNCFLSNNSFMGLAHVILRTLLKDRFGSEIMTCQKVIHLFMVKQIFELKSFYSKLNTLTWFIYKGKPLLWYCVRNSTMPTLGMKPREDSSLHGVQCLKVRVVRSDLLGIGCCREALPERSRRALGCTHIAMMSTQSAVIAVWCCTWHSSCTGKRFG